ncbi:linear amide C-N hydrolase [Paenibacillus albiflavus]|nr:linear amide C-N hydrolase [Paenibacillus albiflavus]
MSTVFHLKRNKVNWICKNQDVIYEGVHLFTNHRDLHKTALVMPPGTPAAWVSKYGSITISQVAKDQPNGGMNEAGLVVEQTTLWQSEYPTADEWPSLNELYWIQYLLDTCSTVEEALHAASNVRIDQSTTKLHYLLADASGDCAIIEFINGQMIVHHDEQLPLPVMTNTVYSKANQDIQLGIRHWFDRDEYECNSMDRYLIVADALQADTDEVRVEDAFRILSTAKREDTVYSLVYDIHARIIYARTSRNQAIVSISLSKFDYSKQASSKAANLQKLHADKGSCQFEAYSAAYNRQAIHAFFRDPVLTSIFKWEITDEMIQYLAHYPDTAY